MSVLEQECMAHRMQPVWVPTAGGMCAAGYIEREEAQVVYVFEELKAKYGPDFPGFGPISGSKVLERAQVEKLQVIALMAPVRFLRRPDGNLTPGFFDPGHRVFFRWRNEVRPPGTANFYFDPSYDPISPVLDPARVVTTLDITTPADAAERAAQVGEPPEAPGD